jgi:hypothetical protein
VSLGQVLERVSLEQVQAQEQLALERVSLGQVLERVSLE